MFMVVVVSKDGAVEKDRDVLIVNIIDEDEPPVCDTDFLQKTASVKIPENFALFRQIYTVPATDVDGLPLTYTVESQFSGPTEDGLFFDVDRDTGFISRTSTTPLDFDAGYEEFRLLIKVTDTTGLSCEGGLIINIIDLNDELPVFVKIPNDTIYVPENTLAGSIIHVFTATDRDAGDRITYSFARPITMFSLSPVTGYLVVLESMDYDDPDVPKAFSLTVTATDKNSSHITYYHVNVYIENVDEPPVCDPAISTGAGIVLSVPETFPTRTTLYTILANDPDEDDVVKMFVSSVKVINTKDNPMSCKGLITINILNENDEAPIFQNISDKPIEVRENLTPGTVVYRVQAHDRDIGDNVQYEFATFYDGFFIDEDSGNIKTSYSLDYENPTTHHEQRLKIHAFDNDRVHIAVQEVTIKLIDVNDNPPKCDGFPSVIEVPETIAVKTLLMTISCRDGDVNVPNNVLKYKLINLDAFSHDKFTLTDNKITTGPHSLDYDSATFAGMHFKHTLLIEVSDSGTPPLTSTVTVIVRVTRVNEERPEDSGNVFSIQENSPVESIVGKVNFTDIDWPFNNMKFTIVAGNYGNPSRFYIEPETGVLKVLNPPDFEESIKYSVTVQAIDLDNDLQPDPLMQLKKLAVATIDITNVNDEPPICVPEYYETVIYSTVKDTFLQLQCSDKDSPAEQLDYSIVSGNTPQRFVLQKERTKPASLATTQNFQYNVFEGIEDPTVFQLLIEVTDEFGGNKAQQLSTTATVIVRVVPWFTTTQITTREPTTTTITTAVLVRRSYFWHPDNWFPAVITITAILLLLCLYALAWGLLKDLPRYAMLFPFCRGVNKQHTPSVMENKSEAPRSKQNPVSNTIQQAENPNSLPGHSREAELYDGRAIDPDSGLQYLFNSQSGAVKWIH
uniref:Cadherin domain-containing protein n=1 Tax=Leptobrachium leishanense TaxID=445787 RepID=A0A8C5Q2G2_9ANUR